MTEQQVRDQLWDMRHVLHASHQVCLALVESGEVPDGVEDAFEKWGEAVGELGDLYLSRAKAMADGMVKMAPAPNGTRA